MLAEMMIYAATPASRAVRRMGLLKDSVSLWARARRCRKAWETHEKACHALIIEAIKNLPRKRKVVVLGSGLVRDIPIKALAAVFDEVLLIDAVHLLPVRLAMHRYQNVRLISRDVTGWIAALDQGESIRRAPMNDMITDSGIDFVISANMLSQLPFSFEAYLERKGHPADAIDAFCKNLIESHLKDLKAFSCPVCLLTDIICTEYDAAGHVIATLDLLRGVSLPEPDAAWQWTVAPATENRGRMVAIHTVHGYRDFSFSLKD
jgi:hypothetical protein